MPLSQPPSFGMAVPSHKPQQAHTSNRVLLTLHSGSAAGLVVDGGSIDGNPGVQLPDLVFIDNPGLPGTYVWSFTPGTKLLDGACHSMTEAGAIALANGPGNKSVIVIDYLDADGRPVAPAKLQLWARASGGVADCEGEQTS